MGSVELFGEHEDGWRSINTKEHGYKIGTLMAFFGEVNDKESGPDGFTANSHALNSNLKGRDIREAFKGDDWGAW